MNYIQKTPFMELYEEMSSLYEQDNISNASMNLAELDEFLKLNLQNITSSIKKDFPNVIPKTCTFCLPAMSDFVTKQSDSVTLAQVARSLIGEKTIIWNYPGIRPPMDSKGHLSSLSTKRDKLNDLLANTLIDTTGGWLCFGFIFVGYRDGFSKLINNYQDCIKYLVNTLIEQSFGVATLENVRFTHNFTFDQKLSVNHLTICIPYDKVASAEDLARYAHTERIIDKLSFNTITKKITYNDIITNNSINADALSELFCQDGVLFVEDPSICSIIANVLPKIGKGESDALKLQKIVNASTQERYLATKLKLLGFTRNSKGLYNGNTETGTDFSGPADLEVEAKMYGSRKLADYYRKKEPFSFHNADFVCVYLIYDKNHWGWLKKTQDGYDWANETDLPDVLAGLTFDELRLCQCSGDVYGWKFEAHRSQAAAVA